MSLKVTDISLNDIDEDIRLKLSDKSLRVTEENLKVMQMSLKVKVKLENCIDAPQGKRQELKTTEIRFQDLVPSLTVKA
jgi:hypothetical protein